MNKEKIKNKLIYFLALGLMCLSLVFIMYNFFYKTVEIDIMKNIKLIYTGENGNASVTVENKTEDLNQRIQEFIESVTYQVSPNTNLSNGDTIHVIASYDEELASTYHYLPINTEKEFIVQGLNNRFESKEEIPEEYLTDILQESKNYIEEHSDEIYLLDPRNTDNDDIKLSDTHMLYCAFLKSTQTSDRIISVYQLDYTSQGQNTTIYYLVCVPNINDGNQVIKQNIYGERAYLSSEELQNLNIESYIQRVFGTQFSIEKIEIVPDQDQSHEE